MSPEVLGKKIIELSESLDDETIKTASKWRTYGIFILSRENEIKAWKSCKIRRR